MKKKLIALLAGALLTLGMAGNALASFGDLYQVIYDKSTATSFEMLTDLGSISSLTGASNLTVGGFSGLLAAPIASGANLQVAYFAVDNTGGNKYVWFASTASTLATNLNKWASLGALGSIGNIEGTYNALSQTVNNGASAAVGSKGGTTNTSYYVGLTGSGTIPGFMGNYIKAGYGAGVEQTLAGAATTNLYYFNAANSSQTVSTPTLTLATNADGSVLVNGGASPTPIPPAFFLMGSGLLGMVGLRRKMNKA